jgi:hypothetical protein
MDHDAGGRLTVVPHLVGIGAEPLEAGLVREADPHGLLIAVALGLEESGHDPADLFGGFHGRSRTPRGELRNRRDSALGL